MRAKKQNLCRYLLTTMISQPITTPFLLKLSVFQPRYYYFITIIIFRLLCFLSSFLFRNFAWTIPCLECSFSYNLFIFQPRCHFLKKKKKNPYTHKQLYYTTFQTRSYSPDTYLPCIFVCSMVKL